mmetsp:Transcript_40603/g.46629  ORF Transcript_40603/g.46629 Transcript_40603/m.46629 type:complete len:107 (-) Transcript_40603:1132-1452(-)
MKRKEIRGYNKIWIEKSSKKNRNRENERGSNRFSQLALIGRWLFEREFNPINLILPVALQENWFHFFTLRLPWNTKSQSQKGGSYRNYATEEHPIVCRFSTNQTAE